MSSPSTPPAPWPSYGLLPEDIPDLNNLVIEDGQPVDGILSEKQMRLLIEPLHGSWAGPPDGQPFVAMADVGVFHSPKAPPIVPDAFVSGDVTQGSDITDRENLSYFVWLRGKVPDVVAEIVSNREGGEDTNKLRAYCRMGVPYYVLFDPNDLLGGGVLRVYERVRGRYRRMAEPYFFEELGLGIRLWEGRFEDMETTWVRWCDRDGNLIPTGTERAEQEKQRADTAVRELEELKRKLREMGVALPS